MKRVIKLLKQLKKAVSYPYKPRSEENNVWKKIYEQDNHTKRRT